MKNIKISSFIYLLITVFLVIDFFGYTLIYNTIISNHEKDTKILFYKIKSQTSDMLAKLSFSYHTQKSTLLKKHKIVYDYMLTHDVNGSLDEIHTLINEGLEDKPYDIYLADKDLIIQNTTYPMDKGFDLSFAKKIFERHWEENVTGCSAPIREKKSNHFLSYTDAYLSRNGVDRMALLEVSFTYRNVAKELFEIQQLITQHPIVKSARAYSFGTEGFVYQLMLKDDPSFKRTSEGIIAAEKRALEVAQKLQNHNIFSRTYKKEGHHYRELYMSAHSPIENDIMIIYTIVIDEDTLHTHLTILHICMFLISILGIIAILFINRVRKKEMRLSEQDRFVQSAMHEIKTPLSIITLNNELRELEYGKDIYTKEIDNALKLLHNSYDSMGFIISKEKLSYPEEILDLAKVIEERIAFFQSIAEANNKMITSAIDSHCRVNISRVELVRFIDNNLSNALKYSMTGTPIDVRLNGEKLSFHNQGEPIKDTDRIFDKYYRENNDIGGYGLGLSIIKEIARAYKIDITLHSDTVKGTTFTYLFKCHTDDMS